ncbi:MAG: 30S ribosomal protein S16 [Bacteroidota bacterium]
MVKIRLRRMGRKRRPIYAIVAADSRSPRDGRFIEDLGRYNPMTEPATVSLNSERVKYWLGQGAQPTDTARSLLSRQGVLLELHMEKKGASAEEIEAAVEAHKTRRGVKAEQGIKLTVKQRKQQALAAEAEEAAAREAEEAKLRREAEEAARKAAEEAQRKAAAEREAQKAAEAAAAQAEQAEANAAQEAADAEAPAAEAEAPAEETAAEAPAEEAPAAEGDDAEKTA